MKLTRIKVECYSGYKADEYPRLFLWKNKEIEIDEVTDRWYQGEGTSGWPLANYFKVKTGGGEQFILKHELESDEWYLCR